MIHVEGNPRLRALHTSPDAPVVDIYLDGTPILPAITYGEVSSYVAITAGRHTVQVFPMAIEPRGVPIIDTTIDTANGEDYTFVLLGRLQDLRSQLLLDSTPLPAMHYAKVRVLDTSPDAPPLDMVLAGGDKVATFLTLGGITPYQEVRAGALDMEVRRSDTGLVVAAVSELGLDSGNICTLVILGLLQGEPGIAVLPLVEAIEMLLPR
jgi:hypothetical protein